MKKFFVAALAALAMAACKNDNAFTVTMTLPEGAVGQKIALLNEGTNDTIAFAQINDTIVTLNGTIDAPTMAVIAVGGYPMGQFVVEAGTITIDNEGVATGSPLNDAFAKFYHETLVPTFQAISEAQSEEAEQNLFNQNLIPAVQTFVEQNVGSPFNPLVLSFVAPYLTLGQANAIIAADPSVANETSVASMLESLKRKDATSAGKKYADLTIKQEDGTDATLSSHIEPGKYTIVDFWASWCGPCRREIPGIKALYEKYHDKGLNVVGVAVWDKPADTQAAIANEGITWPVIFNGTRETTGEYGIMGIPCIMLIGPDGTIIDRDLVGSRLTATVDSVMTAAN